MHRTGLVLDVDGKEVLVSLMRKFDDKTFRRVIMHFALVPDELHLYENLKEASYIEGPEEADRDTHVAKEKLARAKNGRVRVQRAHTQYGYRRSVSIAVRPSWLGIVQTDGHNEKVGDAVEAVRPELHRSGGVVGARPDYRSAHSRVAHGLSTQVLHSRCGHS